MGIGARSRRPAEVAPIASSDARKRSGITASIGKICRPGAKITSAGSNAAPVAKVVAGQRSQPIRETRWHPDGLARASRPGATTVCLPEFGHILDHPSVQHENPWRDRSPSSQRYVASGDPFDGGNASGGLLVRKIVKPFLSSIRSRRACSSVPTGPAPIDQRSDQGS